MMQRLVPLALTAILGMILSGCADLPPELQEGLRDAGISFEGAEGGAPGFGSGGANPDGMASGSGGTGGDSGPPTPGWPPNAGPGPDATPSDTYSDSDGNTYADYEFDSRSEAEDFVTDVSHKLKENGFDLDLDGGTSEGGNVQLPFNNAETGETVVLDAGWSGAGTTYIP